jgi:hypothetical protein
LGEKESKKPAMKTSPFQLPNQPSFSTSSDHLKPPKAPVAPPYFGVLTNKPLKISRNLKKIQGPF